MEITHLEISFEGIDVPSFKIFWGGDIKHVSFEVYIRQVQHVHAYVSNIMNVNLIN